MRDGTQLSTNVFLPKEPGKFAAILFRTPYDKKRELPNNWGEFINAGFAVVTQDVRGKGKSQGKFGDINAEVNDGFDTVEWIAKQIWSTGCVGMLGGSYQGIVQWKAALSKPPHLCAIAPTVAGWDEYTDRYYSRGGALKLGHRMSWLVSNQKAKGYIAPSFENYTRHLPLKSMDEFAAGQPISFWRTVLDHPTFDGFWKTLSTREQLAGIRVPALITGGWYDNYAESDLELYTYLQKNGVKTRAIVGPWPHDISYKFPGDPFGPKASIGLRREQIRFFREHLLREPNADSGSPSLQYFLMGANEWRTATAWPPPEAKASSWYLTRDFQLQQKSPSAARVSFVYDPANPVPTRGGNICCDPNIWQPGPLDQREIEKRPDVLSFSSAELKEPLTVVGPVTVELTIASTALDTDFTAKLVDVQPEGKAVIVSDGILRLHSREGVEKSIPYTPGKPIQITISTGVTAMRFAAGHRLRVEISSSNFPKFDRNLNSGHPSKWVSAKQTIFLGQSRLLLMVLP